MRQAFFKVIIKPVAHDSHWLRKGYSCQVDQSIARRVRQDFTEFGILFELTGTSNFYSAGSSRVG